MNKDTFQTEVSEPLMEMNDSLTTESDSIDEMMLEGKLGFHIFADSEPESLVSGLQKEVFAAFSEALETAFLGGLSEDDIRSRYGEVSPRTVAQHVENELEHADVGHGLRGYISSRVEESLSERQQSLQETGSEQGADA